MTSITPWYFAAELVCFTIDTASEIFGPVGFFQSSGTFNVAQTAPELDRYESLQVPHLIVLTGATVVVWARPARVSGTDALAAPSPSVPAAKARATVPTTTLRTIPPEEPDHTQRD